MRDAFDPFWVQGDSFDGLPISGVTAPSGRSVLLGLFIDLMAMSQDSFVFTCMTLTAHFTALAKSYGLQQEFITPHCPQQNGMVERVVRSLKE